MTTAGRSSGFDRCESRKGEFRDLTSSSPEMIWLTPRSRGTSALLPV